MEGFAEELVQEWPHSFLTPTAGPMAEGSSLDVMA